jgi:putative transcriptional regulator
MPLSEKELLKRDASRNIGAELLQAVKDVKAGRGTVVYSSVIDAREKSNLSQVAFAVQLGVSVRTLQGWEHAERLWLKALERFKGSVDDRELFKISLRGIVADFCLDRMGDKASKLIFKSLAGQLSKLVRTTNKMRKGHLLALQAELEKIKPKCGQGMESLPSDLNSALNAVTEISLACRRLAKSYQPTAVKYQPHTDLQNKFETFKPIARELLIARAIRDVFYSCGKRFSMSEDGFAADCFRAVMAKLGSDLTTVKNWLAKANS